MTHNIREYQQILQQQQKLRAEEGLETTEKVE